MKICLTCEGVLDRDDALCAHCGGPLVDLRAVLAPVRRGDDESHGPLVGRVVDGKYRIVGVLGRGGMGTVYRAVHEVSLVAVALKVLHPRWAARADFRAYFLAEARKAGRVLHEGTARILDVGAAPDGTVYLAVELVDGQTFAEWLASNEPADTVVIVELLEQIARATAAAHAAGVVHRDLSPRNVMVVQRDDRLVAKVLDFGIAVQPPPSMRGANAGDHDTDSPSGFANPPYSAPEHLAGRAVDPRADLYSLGVIAYEALTGELPVAGTTAREFARETLEGRIRPMRPRAGVPRALQRLVQELIQSDPDDRPASAHEVAERLRKLRQPRRRALASWSVVALVLSVAAVSIAYSPGPHEVYLRARARAGARGLSLAAGAGVDVLRSTDLLDTRFDFQGFHPRELEISVERGHVVLARKPLAPLLEVHGNQLAFALTAAPFVDDLRRHCVGGEPVDLVLLVPGRAPIGHARVLVDDVPPAIDLRFPRATDATDALRGDDPIEIAASDVGGVARLVLEVVPIRAGAARGERIGVELKDPPSSATARALLGRVFEGARSAGTCAIRLHARDRAGNEQDSEEFVFGDVDLAAPSIVEVGGPGSGDVVVQDSSGAAVRFHVDELEPGLAMFARLPGAADDDFLALPIVASSGNRLDALLIAGEQGALAPSGRWAFRLVDPVGNRGEVFEEDLVVRSADPGEVLRPAPRAGASGNGIAEFADGFVADQGPWRLLLHVDPRYRPSGCSITRADGSAADLRLENVADGQAAIAVDTIEAGEWQLVATVHDERRSAHLDLPARAVRVLEGFVELRVPRVARDAFLVELAERAVLEVLGTSVAQGAAWELRPADARLVRGRVWTRVGDALVARELGVPGTAPQALLPPSTIGRGWHEILVELEDVLGRPVRVLTGEEPAELVEGPGGARLALVARFFAHDAPLRQAQSVANFEYGQPLSLTLASELPPRDGFAWRILVGETSVPCSRATRTAYGEELRFDVPFEVAAAATDLLALGTAEFAAGRDARLDVRVTSPAGPSELRIPVRTIRTTLRALNLADLRADLPPEIGAIRLVPVTGPGVGRAFKDPVPGIAAGRSRYRPSAPIDVRNVPDVYLQDQELTWAQYQAIVAAGLLRVAELPPEERARLAAADDPLGAARWTSAALAPRATQPVAGQMEHAGQAERPVVGVDFRQAVAVARLLGFLVANDPDFVRLPLGVELELAAFGAGERTGTALHGASARGGGLDALALRAAALDLGSVARWPPTRVQAEALGDVVSTELGDRITGLDLGAREWVLDLPCPPPDARGRALVLEWRADHPRHLERIALATAKREPDELGVFVGNRAILRGQATGEDPAIPSDEHGRVPPDWPGVVRELQMRRDGGGLVPQEPDPHLGLAGLRIAGGERFVAEVRGR